MEGSGSWVRHMRSNKTHKSENRRNIEIRHLYESGLSSLDLKFEEVATQLHIFQIVSN